MGSQPNYIHLKKKSRKEIGQALYFKGSDEFCYCSEIQFISV